MDKSFKELLPQITTLIFDVDGVLTDGGVHVFENGELVRKMNVKDGYALKCALQAGFRVCIISGGSNEGVRTRLQGLGITDIYLGAHNKIDQYYELQDMYEFQDKEVLYMGDDIPDYPVMTKVGIAACPQDAAPEIKGISHYISHRNGGYGCVRDVLEQVMKVQGKWNDTFDAKYD
ncbi:HAD-IIIA family hydrolase [Urechidicola sp. KH5]